jgi:hypothetical protein
MQELKDIQVSLVAPKNQFNSFGKYNYRSCEDIMMGLKPHLSELKCSVVISDDIVMIGDRIYVKATATLINEKGDKVSCNGFAREPVMKKGMDEAQITGSASSYARKYALNGLFAIDDSKDVDYLNTESGRKRVVLIATIEKFTVAEFFKSNNIDSYNACVRIAQQFKVEKVTIEELTVDMVQFVFQYQQYFVDTFQL